MRYDIIPVRGYYEVYAPDGRFLLSADTRWEAEQEMENWKEETIA